MAGLVFEHHGAGVAAENVGTGIKDPLKNLVYRVHPLPESMIDYIFDFGALSSEVSFCGASFLLSACLCLSSRRLL